MIKNLRQKKIQTKPAKSKILASRSGFTVIEFSLATTFIAVLLIVIAIIISSIISTYQKGLSIKAVNSVGRNLIDELTTTINSAPSVDATSLCGSHFSNKSDKTSCTNDFAYKFVFQEKTGAPPSESQASTKRVQLAGVLCTGSYSYIWNTYYGKEGKGLSLTYKTSAGENTIEPRLARFSDPTYRACSVSIGGSYDPNLTLDAKTGINITTLDNNAPNILPSEPEMNFLTGIDLQLWLYELTIFHIAQDLVTLRTFMSGTFVLATDRGDININRTGDYCNPNNTEGAGNLLDLGAEFNYCAINKFNFAARTSGL